MPLATRAIPESTISAGLSPSAGRPLFVPVGLAVVRTGPTTRAEFDRLLSDADDAELSGVRLSATSAVANRGLFQTLAAVLGFASSRR